MFTSDGSRELPNDSIESFIGENLSIFQARWLIKQTEAGRQTRSDLFEAILREWFARNPPEFWTGMQEGEIARRAVGEFILWHREEFLSVSCFER
jgi:RecB family exonuclease